MNNAGDGEFLKVQPYFINPRTMNQVAGPVTLLECQKLGGHALLGLFSGTMCEAASLLSHSFRESSLLPTHRPCVNSNEHESEVLPQQGCCRHVSLIHLCTSQKCP